MGNLWLNLGLQDAVNLGWKLAGEIHGWAPEGLLDSYESERRPAGERVVMQTQAQAALIAPSRDVTALRTLFDELLASPANIQHVADLMSGADISYGGGEHPLIGRWAPDLIIEGDPPRRLAELARSGRPLLIDFTTKGRFCELVPRDRIEIVRGRPPVTEALAALLVRPDGFVAWAATEVTASSWRDLSEAMAHWFGVMLPDAALATASDHSSASHPLGHTEG